jgi:DNA topoisomerase-1
MGRIKDAKDELEKPYLHAIVDGRREKAGNFRAEPPGLFRGRGEHPRKGTLKVSYSISNRALADGQNRLRPEDIIINIGKEAPVPVPNIPGQWKAVCRLIQSTNRKG